MNKFRPSLIAVLEGLNWEKTKSGRRLAAVAPTKEEPELCWLLTLDTEPLYPGADYSSGAMLMDVKTRSIAEGLIVDFRGTSQAEAQSRLFSFLRGETWKS